MQAGNLYQDTINLMAACFDRFGGYPVAFVNLPPIGDECSWFWYEANKIDVIIARRMNKFECRHFIRLAMQHNVSEAEAERYGKWPNLWLTRPRRIKSGVRPVNVCAACLNFFAGAGWPVAERYGEACQACRGKYCAKALWCSVSATARKEA